MTVRVPRFSIPPPSMAELPERVLLLTVSVPALYKPAAASLAAEPKAPPSPQAARLDAMVVVAMAREPQFTYSPPPWPYPPPPPFPIMRPDDVVWITMPSPPRPPLARLLATILSEMSKEPPVVYRPPPTADPPLPAHWKPLWSPPRPPMVWLFASVAPAIVSAPPVE